MVGIDRGVAIPAHAGFKAFPFSNNEKKSLSKSERYIKRQQKRLAKQKQGANRRNKTKRKLSNHYAKSANIRLDFCHKTSRTLVDSKYKVFVFEDLKTSNMTRKPKEKQNDNGRYLPNKARAKAGLNKAILSSGWHMIKKHAIKLILNSGTELSAHGVLSLSDNGRGGKSKTGKRKRKPDQPKKRQKRQVQWRKLLNLEARSFMAG